MRKVAPSALALAALLVSLAGACGSRQTSPTDPALGGSDTGRQPDQAAPLRPLRGKASFYGGKHHGGPTASGERFDKNAMTAANRDLRFDTIVRVTNLNNGKQVTVRINDRGPFGQRERIIDLSEAAARKLDMIRAGVVPVTVEVLEEPPPKPKKGKWRKKR